LFFVLTFYIQIAALHKLFGMRLLLCVSSLYDIKPFLDKQEEARKTTDWPFLTALQVLQHQIDVLETGAGIFQTTYKLTKTLVRQKYHLALKLSLGNAFKSDYNTGTVLNIVNEKPGDYGVNTDDGWKDLYDLNLLQREETPHVRGGFVNLTNAYMNVFIPYKKAVGVTVNHYADNSRAQLRADKYKADIETTDGLGFVYPCLYEKQNFYHLCIVEKNLATGEHESALARQVMNSTLSELITLL
jgi:futalosine hydrolase